MSQSEKTELSRLRKQVEKLRKTLRQIGRRHKYSQSQIGISYSVGQVLKNTRVCQV